MTLFHQNNIFTWRAKRQNPADERRPGSWAAFQLECRTLRVGLWRSQPEVGMDFRWCCRHDRMPTIKHFKIIIHYFPLKTTTILGKGRLRFFLPQKIILGLNLTLLSLGVLLSFSLKSKIILPDMTPIRVLARSWSRRERTWVFVVRRRSGWSRGWYRRPRETRQKMPPLQSAVRRLLVL